jgi:cytochrome c oxidase subunit II
MATVSQEQQSSTKVSVMPLIVFGVLSLLFGLLVALAVPDFFGLLPSMLPEAASTQATNTDALFRVLIGLGGVVFFLVQGLIYYAAIAFRAPANDDSDGPNLHGNLLLELVWTLIPSIIVVFLAIYAFTVWQTNTAPSATPNLVAGEGIRINGFGQRFAWTFQYETNARGNIENPDGTIAEGAGDPIVLTTNDLYVFAGQNVELNLESRDVIHAFWAPEMRVKQDLLPGRLTVIRFTPIEPETSDGLWDGIMVNGNVNLYASPDIASEVLVPALVLEEGQLPEPVAFRIDHEAASADGFVAVIDSTSRQTAYLSLAEVEVAGGATGQFNSYRLICAELCGGGHGEMYTEVIMFEDAEAFERAWYNPMVAIASIPPGNPIELGQQVITPYGCAGCHTLSSMGWSGVVGPSLDGIGERAATQAVPAEAQSGNELTSGTEYIVQSLRNPHAYLVPPYGALMRVFGSGNNPPPGVASSNFMPMPQEDLIGIVAFLCTQTGSSPSSSTCGLENWEFDETGAFIGDSAALTEELRAISDEYEE